MLTAQERRRSVRNKLLMRAPDLDTLTDIVLDGVMEAEMAKFMTGDVEISPFDAGEAE